MYLRANSKYKPPPGSYIRRGDLTEGFTILGGFYFKGLIFGISRYFKAIFGLNSLSGSKADGCPAAETSLRFAQSVTSVGGEKTGQFIVGLPQPRCNMNPKVQILGKREVLTVKSRSETHF